MSNHEYGDIFTCPFSLSTIVARSVILLLSVISFFMTIKDSQMFITGPAVIKAVTGENVSSADLGEADVHSRTSGVCHFVYENEAGLS